MDRAGWKSFVTVENMFFLLDGFGSITRFGIFFGVLILLTLIFDWITGFSNFGLRSVIFLLAVYFVIVFFSISVVIVLRLKAVSALKNKSTEEYLKFLKSDKNRKHEILGRLV